MSFPPLQLPPLEELLGKAKADEREALLSRITKLEARIRELEAGGVSPPSPPAPPKQPEESLPPDPHQAYVPLFRPEDV